MQANAGLASTSLVFGANIGDRYSLNHFSGSSSPKSRVRVYVTPDWYEITWGKHEKVSCTAKMNGFWGICYTSFRTELCVLPSYWYRDDTGFAGRCQVDTFG